MITRRGLFRGAAAVATVGAAGVLAKLPAPPVRKTTIRMGMPSPTWRKLHEGVQPSKHITRVVEVLNRRNEILDDLPWKEEV